MLSFRAARDRYHEVRQRTDALAAPVSPEDAQVQSMPDVSPTKWHLAHTSWFFETFLLRACDPAYAPHDDRIHYLFNSYYEAEGPRQPRPLRGLITRPTLDEVRAYRAWVDERMDSLLAAASDRDDWPAIAALIELGCHHEEQHQELLLTDIKHVLAQNPFPPRYATPYPKAVAVAPALAWRRFDAGLYDIGHDGEGFAFDNESPRHARHVAAFALATRPVTNGEYMEFIADGGYATPSLWLSNGWDWVQSAARRAPLYWDDRDGDWHVFTLYGRQPVHPHEPVCHLSLYEADAFATWAGARLPREEELETAAMDHAGSGPVNDLSSGRLHPAVAPDGDGLAQLVGDVWEWTGSAYLAYPGYTSPAGAVGEYNGKFMCDQTVLRGGSCATPPGHWRPTYRNFFPSDAQWQFTGLRLAKDVQ